MKKFNTKINHIFKMMKQMQIILFFVFETTVIVRYVLLMGIQKTVDSISIETEMVTQDYLKDCVVLVALFFVLNAAFQYGYRYLEYTGHYSLMKGLFSLSLRKAFPFYEKYSSAKVLTMIKDDSKFIADWKSTGTMTLMLNITSLIIALGMMLYYSVSITAVVGGVVIGCYLCTNYISKAISNCTYDLQEANTEISNQIIECVDGIKDIRQYNEEKFFENQLGAYIDGHAFKRSKKISRLYAGYVSIYAVLVIVLPIFVVLIGVKLVMEGKLTIGSVMALYGIASTLQEPIQVIPDYLAKRKQALAMQGKLEPVLDEEERKYSIQDIGKMKKIEFDSEKYIFEDGKAILKDVRFTITPKESVIIKGSSGVGKSSLLKIISRFYDSRDQLVEIKYNGIPIEEIEPKVYYSHIIQVQQSPYIFCDSVLRNITLGKEYSEEEIEEVIKATCLESFVEHKGYDYKIEKEGSNISGGEKQRLGLARALLRKPDLLMLDEPTSALNPAMIEVLTMRVAEYCAQKNIALLVVSHNNSFEEYYGKQGEILNL